MRFRIVKAARALVQIGTTLLSSSLCHVLEDDICCGLHEFQTNRKIPRGANASFIALIPQVDNPQNLGDYTPISFIRYIYKIIAKVLTKRLKRVIHKIIHEEQLAFVGGRNKLDGFVIANKVVDEAKRSKNQRCSSKWILRKHMTPQDGSQWE